MKTVILVVVMLCSLNALFARAGKETALCMICAMRGETAAEEVVATREFEGKTYSFCSDKCAAEFEQDPDAYVFAMPRPAPTFGFTTLTGDSLTLASFRGEWVVLDFWATWCKPCVETMPDLDAWSKTGGVRAIGVSIDTGNDREKKVRKFLQKHPVGYPVAVDATNKPAWEQYKVKILPTVVLIDPQGQIVARQVGSVDLAALRRVIEATRGKGG
jgi:thiol-disulfide isomerase/thioredoxin